MKKTQYNSVEDVKIPPGLHEIIKQYAKAVLKNRPEDIIDFSKK